MKKLIFLVVVLVVAGGGYYYYESQKPPQVPEFMKVAISQGDVVESVSATGTLQADRMVIVGSKVSGVIDKLYVDFNSLVKAGDVLAKVNTDQLDTQVRIQQANIAQRQVDIANQRVQLADAERTLQRTKELFDAKLVTEQAWEASDLAVKSRVAQIESAEKAMVQAEANLAQAELNVEEATIVSPINGVVVNRLVDEGVTIVGSQSVTPFFHIATELNVMKLEGGVDEAEIGKVRTGMRVVFTVDAYGTTPFQGEITMVRLNPTVQSNVVTYTTVARVLNNDLRLQPGMTASMNIEVARRDNVLRVPVAALRFRPTNDMWTTLKQEPPTPVGRGAGRNGGARQGGDAGATTPAAAGTATPQAAAPQGGEAGANPFATAGRTGGGRTGGMTATLTPEQQKQLEAIRDLPADQRAAAMARAGISIPGGGRGRGGRGGRGGGNGQSAAPRPVPQGATSIDQLRPELVRNPTRGQVYVLRPADATHPHGTLERLDIMQGISDGTFAELVSGPAELTVGTELVSNILMPWLAATTTGGATNQGNPFSGQQGGRGGFGGGGRGR
jgi:HlyD family secretion protein